MVNRLQKLSPQFKKILKTSSLSAKSLGVNIYLVGGVVRDLILKKEVFDLDIVVEGNAIVFVKKLASRLGAKFNRHHSFGTATLYFDQHKIDFATARTEEYRHWGALPSVSPAPLAKDLLRRDFSINAMAISLNKPDYGALIDLSNGLSDLKRGLIRVLHPMSFQEDPTRILRAIRFEQRLSFKIEANTFKLMKEALGTGALKLVSPHRLRDEIILILSEPRPYRCIRRIKELGDFSFLDKRIRTDGEFFRLFLRIEKAYHYYQKKFARHRKLKVWLLYLAALLSKLTTPGLKKFFHDFGFRKGERTIVSSIVQGKHKIKRLSRQAKASTIYRILGPYSFESILFFYAYYKEPRLRKNIEHFLDKLVDINLKVKGQDLKEMDLRPHDLYGKVLRQTLYSKIDKDLKGKHQELKELKRIFKRHKK
ncbi:MAG: hypothetical protein ABIE75_00850 [Candidatus Omnitrophota bacterium]